MIIKADVDNVIALCHIMDDFKELERRLTPILSNNSFRNQLGIISKGKNQIVSSTVYRFYRENKSIIDTINKYSEITNFIDSFYYTDGNPKIIMFFAYEYILSHKDEIDKILAVLQKLKKLGFSEFELDENYDASKAIYTVHQAFGFNYEIYYVDNIQHILVANNIVHYRTTGSNYLIIINLARKEKLNDRRIFLNSLLFDPKKLPESISKENTFDRILDPNKKTEEKPHNINSDNLSKCFIDLEEQINFSSMIINGLDRVEDRDKLIEITSNIRNNVEKLKDLIASYNNSASNQTSSLDQRNLSKRKKYIVRKKNGNN